MLGLSPSISNPKLSVKERQKITVTLVQFNILLQLPGDCDIYQADHRTSTTLENSWIIAHRMHWKHVDPCPRPLRRGSGPWCWHRYWSKSSFYICSHCYQMPRRTSYRDRLYYRMTRILIVYYIVSTQKANSIVNLFNMQDQTST